MNFVFITANYTSLLFQAWHNANHFLREIDIVKM